MQEPTVDRAIFKMPYEVVKTLLTTDNSGLSDTSFKIRRQFVKTLGSDGTETLTAGTNEVFTAHSDVDFLATITASGGCIHCSEMRKLALCESQRAMSLPDDFKLTGKWEQRSERMGRMVPPLMMKAIADSVYENVLKPYKEKTNG